MNESQDLSVDESCIEKYEAALVSGSPISIESLLLQKDDLHYVGTLVELTLIEQEVAWKSARGTGDEEQTVGVAPLVEAYVDRFPALDEPAILKRLIAHECYLRQRYSETPPFSEYRERFPDIIRSRSDLPEAADSSDSQILPGAMIGNYKLLQEIGTGGFGIVYMAEQKEPVRRRVALKVIKAGMDTREVIARFEAERQALAMMDHPNIARVLDAGSTDAGRPYFVMQLVKGVSITEYCDSNKLSIQERLDLFIQVCRAIQHAHQKGIIHRDIKPSNILVAQFDGKPSPKVIDFGIAKATQQRLTEKTMFTRFGQIIGTPQYMSPEQAEMNELDVDTRSDVYSLGVVLYELFAGSTPIRHERLRSAGYEEMLRLIREQDAPTPSHRISQSDSALPQISKQRKLDARSLRRALQGELDWIVMKSLEKDRTRRYESASAFAADIERFLKQEPVEAGPPSSLYELRKLANRHWGLLTTVAAFALLLIVGIGVSTWQAIVATYAKSRAETAERTTAEAFDEAKNARNDAEAALVQVKKAKQETDKALLESEKSRAKSDAALEFLHSAFERTQPGLDGKNLTVFKALQTSTEQLEDDDTLDPYSKAELFDTIATTYMKLGMTSEAIGIYNKGLATLRHHEKDFTGLDFLIKRRLAKAYAGNGQKDFAIRVAEDALESIKRIYGDDADITIRQMVELANLHFPENEEVAVRIAEDALKLRKKNAEPDFAAISALGLIGRASIKQGDVEKGIEQIEEVVRMRLEMDEQDDEIQVNAYTILGDAYVQTGRYDDALETLKKAVRLAESELSANHDLSISANAGLASALMKMHRYRDAIHVAEDTIDVAEEFGGETHPQLLPLRITVGESYELNNEPERAVEAYREAKVAARRQFGDDDAHILAIDIKLARQLWAANQVDEALALVQQNIETSKRLKLPNSSVQFERLKLAYCYSEINRLEESRVIAKDVYRQFEKEFGRASIPATAAANLLASLHYYEGDYQRAFELHSENYEFVNSVFSEEEKTIAGFELSMGLNAEAVGKYEQAIAHYEGYIASCKVTQFPFVRELAISAKLRIANSLSRQGKYVEAHDTLRAIDNGDRRGVHLKYGFLETEYDSIKAEVEFLIVQDRTMKAGEEFPAYQFARTEQDLLSAQSEYRAMLSPDFPTSPFITLMKVRSKAENEVRIVRLYEAWGKPELAEMWREEPPTPR